MGIFHRNLVALRPAEKSDEDLQFLFLVFNSTRAAEMAMTGWSELEVDSFLRMQFRAQDLQYRQNYPNASFNIIKVNGSPAGRFYVSRGRKIVTKALSSPKSTPGENLMENRRIYRESTPPPLI